MRIAGFLLLASFLVTGARADIISSFDIHVDIPVALQGQSGYLDFQFSPGTAANGAFANLSGFNTDGALILPTLNSGDVSGTLPGPVTINDTTVYNDYNEGLTFGSFFDISVSLDFPSISTTDGDTLVLSLFASNNIDEVISNNSNPGLIEIALDNNGNPTLTNYSPNSEATVSQTPEPNALLLLVPALGLIPFVRRRTTQNVCD